METKSSINLATGISPVDIQYISNEYIPPSKGGGKRGKTMQFTKKALVEFAITKRFLNYGITVKAIKSIIEFLRLQKSYQRLFNEAGDLVNRKIISGKTKIYLQIFDAKPATIKLHLDDETPDFKFCFPDDSKKQNYGDMMVLDITPEFHMIVVTKEDIRLKETVRVKVGN